MGKQWCRCTVVRPCVFHMDPLWMGLEEMFRDVLKLAVSTRQEPDS